MTFIEIVIIVTSVLFVLGVIIKHFYNKKKNLPTGECAYCSHKDGGKALIKAYRKQYPKN